MTSRTEGLRRKNRLLEAIRLCDEISQAEFARKLHISRAQLCDIEKGRKNVSPERAARYAKILGYSEKSFVELALQDLLTEAGMQYQVRAVATSGQFID